MLLARDEGFTPLTLMLSWLPNGFLYLSSCLHPLPVPDVFLSLFSVHVPFQSFRQHSPHSFHLHIVLLCVTLSLPLSLLDIAYIIQQCIPSRSFSLARLWLSAQLGLSPLMSNLQVSTSLDSILAVVPMYLNPHFLFVQFASSCLPNAFSQGTCVVASADPPLKQYGGNDGAGQMTHFTKDDGLNIFRLPVGWQYLVNGVLGGTLDETNFGKYDALVQACLQTGAHCIIDIHNYARWNGKVIGASGGPKTSDFSGLWGQLAEKYKDEGSVVMGLMNEPHDSMSLIPSFCLRYRIKAMADKCISRAGTRSSFMGGFRPGCRDCDSQGWRYDTDDPSPWCVLTLFLFPTLQYL